MDWEEKERVEDKRAAGREKGMDEWEGWEAVRRNAGWYVVAVVGG